MRDACKNGSHGGSAPGGYYKYYEFAPLAFGMAGRAYSLQLMTHIPRCASQ